MARKWVLPTGTIITQTVVARTSRRWRARVWVGHRTVYLLRTLTSRTLTAKKIGSNISTGTARASNMPAVGTLADIHASKLGCISLEIIQRVSVGLAFASRPAREIPLSLRAVDQIESTSEIIEFVRPLKPTAGYGSEINSRAQRIHDTVSAYGKRIQVLEEQAELDGYSLNPISKAAFFAFFKRNPLARRGRLVLMENGNLRATWKGRNGAHIGLQFLNNQSVQYVIFTRREPLLPVSRVSGRDTMDGIRRQIDGFELRDVLYK